MNAQPALRLHLVRHGETEWSRSGQHTGRTEVPLTPHGEQTARELAPLLNAQSYSAVLTSPRLRARSTCKWAGLGAAAEVDADLAEWDYGDYEGLRSDDIHLTRPGWNVWRDGCPGGESPAAACARADRLLARLARLSGDVALFGHGQFGRLLVARWIGLPATAGQHFAMDPASLGILGTQDRPPGQRVVLLWNATRTVLQPPA